MDALLFAHEIGHGRHDRYNDPYDTLKPYSHGYVNSAFEPEAPEQSRWRTIMATGSQCHDEGFRCRWILRFANPCRTRGWVCEAPHRPPHRDVVALDLGRVGLAHIGNPSIRRFSMFVQTAVLWRLSLSSPESLPYSLMNWVGRDLPTVTNTVASRK